MREPLLGVGEHPLDVGFRNGIATGGRQCLLQNRILLRVDRNLRVALGIDDVTGFEHGVQVLGADFGARHHRRDLLLLDHLPIDEFLDVGMIQVQTDHLGRAPGRAARLDGAGRAVADPEKRHQAGRAPAAGQRFAVAAQFREIRSGAGPVLEEPRLPHPEIHDAVLVDEIVLDRLDEAGVGLRMLERVGRLHHLAGLRIDVVVALRRTGESVRIMQSRVEPLGGIGRGHLVRQHVTELVVERGAVFDGLEIAVGLAPMGPAAGQPSEHLAGVTLPAQHRFAVRSRDRIAGLVPLRHPGLAEILLSQNVDGQLRPGFRNVDLVQLEYGRSIGIANLR